MENTEFKIGDKVKWFEPGANTDPGNETIGIVVAMGHEGITVDFGEGFSGHDGSGFIGNNKQENFSEGDTCWFFDYDDNPENCECVNELELVDAE